MKTVLVIGGGAAGLMAAGTAAMKGCKVTLLERNDKLGRKLAITGKGRCNVTNSCPLVSDVIRNIPVGGRFLYGALTRFTTDDTMEFFERRGVQLKIERGNRVFPVSDNAFDIVDALNRFITENRVKRVTARTVGLIMSEDRVLGAVTEDKKEYLADAVIVATGGLSYPQTGSTGDGYAFARQAGHTVVPQKPSLVPLECHEGWCSDTAGLTLKNIALTVMDTDTGREVYKDFGELLITHFGVSGPVILSASSHMRDMKRGKFALIIDLKPALSEEQLDKRIVSEIGQNPNKNVFNLVSTLLPRSLVPVAVRLSGIDGTQKANQLTREARSELIRLLKGLRLTVTGFRPIEEAVITSGGVALDELDPRTMQSKMKKGLYFAGEVIDADAYTGGFNLQIAFSTGFLAGFSQDD